MRLTLLLPIGRPRFVLQSTVAATSGKSRLSVNTSKSCIVTGTISRPLTLQLAVATPMMPADLCARTRQVGHAVKTQRVHSGRPLLLV
jgi:hypothetical protein